MQRDAFERIYVFNIIIIVFVVVVVVAGGEHEFMNDLFIVMNVIQVDSITNELQFELPEAYVRKNFESLQYIEAMCI